ncbi:MAG: hypothetical protein HY401_04690 [Elusimicrobia bacterium]|nr:hypothetical protein [Elusimicrobiota bacterium]
MLINSLYASDLLGPIHFPTGQHKGEGVALNYEIKYLDPWGHTIADAGGLHFCHDRLAPGYCSDAGAPEDQLPSKYWGSYPLYYSGMTMRYQIILRNNGPRSYRNLRVVAIQEYLDAGAAIGAKESAMILRETGLRKNCGRVARLF